MYQNECVTELLLEISVSCYENNAVPDWQDSSIYGHFSLMYCLCLLLILRQHAVNVYLNDAVYLFISSAGDRMSQQCLVATAVLERKRNFVVLAAIVKGGGVRTKWEETERLRWPISETRFTGADDGEIWR